MRGCRYFDEIGELLVDHVKQKFAVERLQLNMTMYASLLAQASSVSGPFWYLTEELSVIAPHLLRSDTTPMLEFQSKDNQARDSQAPMVSLWMGSPGVVTQLHYDMPANLFVQLR
jgi:hypothetical protein